ncbi:MAG: FlgD immunoglobulin-like domain containing protein [bacterium]
MIRHMRWAGCIAALLGIGWSAPTAGVAQTGGEFDLSWSTIDAGGASWLAGGDFLLGGTSGQPDAGVLTGGEFVLAGGFWGGGVVATAVPDGEFGPVSSPSIARLYRVAPNPFDPSTEISFDLAEPGDVRLAVYNLQGRLVRRLMSGPRPAGRYRQVWDGHDDSGAAVASGVYFVTIDAGPFHARQKAVLLR